MKNILLNPIRTQTGFLRKYCSQKFYFFLIIFSFPVGVNAVEIGMLAPEFDLIGLNGNVHLNEYKGNCAMRIMRRGDLAS